MFGPGGSVLRPEDSVLLAHALADYVASTRGIRLLAVKGPVAELHGLRPSRSSADADVLVDPDSVDEFCAAMSEYGWAERPQSWLASQLIRHSRTLISPDWPCDIDVHRSFPGFMRDNRKVFDSLWDRRDHRVVARRDLSVAGFESSVLIGALHGLRSPAQSPRHRAEVESLAREVVPNLSDSRYQELVALAVAAGATDTARPVFHLRDHGLPAPTAPGVDPNLDAWRIRTASGGGRSSQVLEVARSAGIKGRLRLVAALVWQRTSEFGLDYPAHSVSTGAALAARTARLSRGWNVLGDLRRGYRYMKQGKDDTALVDGENPW